MGTSSVMPRMGSAVRLSAAMRILALVSADIAWANSKLSAESPAMVMVNPAMQFRPLACASSYDVRPVLHL